MSIFTIGHSNLDLETFISLLQQHEITAVADVRSHPYSRYLPHFNTSALKAKLKSVQIHYVFLGAELGARPEDINCYVNQKALYTKIAARTEFQQGIQRLIEGEKKYNIALMCAEKDPITCHRAVLVCQHLREFGVEIKHILGDGAIENHLHLEERLLILQGLDESTLSQPTQLSLFATPPHLESLLSREERLQEAYRRQGDKIAYVEKERDE